jgi:putative tryptophan/tyrosine transport system substrate-binding protein
MRRREFITLLGGAAAWPLPARTQQAIPVVGFIRPTSAEESAKLVGAFRRGLSELGYVEGQNVAIEYRWADNQYDRLPALATDLVRRKVAVIVATGGTSTTLAVKAVTTAIQIVFISGSDPVKDGLVASLNRPGGNLTGVSSFSSALGAKRLELLREFVPTATIIALLVNPHYAEAETQVKEVEGAAVSFGQQVLILKASTERDINRAFETIVQQRASALIVATDPFIFSRKGELVALAARHKVPTDYPWSEFTAAGGLMSYGASLTDAYRQAGIYAGKILNGAKPGDLPVQQAVKIEFVINLKTANALGITFPLPLSGRADEVIE